VFPSITLELSGAQDVAETGDKLSEATKIAIAKASEVNKMRGFLRILP
jgi:hypothetical protein